MTRKDDLKDNIRDKFYQFKWNSKRKFNKACRWMVDNKELVLLVGPTVIGGVTWGVKSLSRNIKIKKTENLKNLYCYDRSLGHYWKLRRELTNDEWVLIDKRKKSGERLADILDELKVLR